MIWHDTSHHNDGRPAFACNVIDLLGTTLAAVEYYHSEGETWKVALSIMDQPIPLPSDNLSHEAAREAAVRIAQALRLMWPNRKDTE
jgi:hypothetical protein